MRATITIVTIALVLFVATPMAQTTDLEARVDELETALGLLRKVSGHSEALFSTGRISLSCTPIDNLHIAKGESHDDIHNLDQAVAYPSQRRRVAQAMSAL